MSEIKILDPVGNRTQAAWLEGMDSSNRAMATDHYRYTETVLPQ